jgi:hypothetical protein
VNYPQQSPGYAQQPFGSLDQRPGYPPPLRPKKKLKLGKIIGLTAAAVIGLGVVGIGGTAVVILVVSDTSIDVVRPPGTPRQIAQLYADAVERREPNLLDSVTCHPSTEYSSKEWVKNFARHGYSITVLDETPQSGGEVTVGLEIRRTDGPPQRVSVSMVPDAGGWCAGLTGSGLPGGYRE